MESGSALQTDKSSGVGDEDFQTGKILTLSIAHFIHDVYSSFLAPLLPLLIEKLSMSLTQAGFLSTVMQIPALLNPYIGVLADRISVRYLVILAPAMTAVPMSLIGMAPGYGVLLILLFVTGISVSVFHVPAPVMVADLSAARKGRGMSFFMTGGELARTVGPLVAVAAVSLFGLEDFYRFECHLFDQCRHGAARHTVCVDVTQEMKYPNQRTGIWLTSKGIQHIHLVTGVMENS